MIAALVWPVWSCSVNRLTFGWLCGSVVLCDAARFLSGQCAARSGWHFVFLDQDAPRPVPIGIRQDRLRGQLAGRRVRQQRRLVEEVRPPTAPLLALQRVLV